jgi:hypothetical protein
MPAQFVVRCIRNVGRKKMTQKSIAQLAFFFAGRSLIRCCFLRAPLWECMKITKPRHAHQPHPPRGLRFLPTKGNAGQTGDCGDCPKTVLNTINVTYVRNVLSVIQAKIWPKKRFIRPIRGNRQKR